MKRVRTLATAALAACYLLFAPPLWAQRAAPNAASAAKDIRAAVLRIAAGFKGVPYKYGAESPSAFDCSGFVRYVYRAAAGLELPRSARSYVGVGSGVALKDALPGDIVVFNTVGSGASHVALYLGDDRVIHAVSDGPKTGVIESPLSDRYWGGRVIGVRSVLAAGLPADPSAGAAAGRSTAGGSTAGRAAASGPMASTAPAAAAASPAGADRASPAPGDNVSYIALALAKSKSIVDDAVPTEPGASLAFAVRNETGAAGDFIVQLYVIDARTYALKELYREKIRLPAGGVMELPAYRFIEPGKYRIAVKGSWGDLILERSFEVRRDR